MAQRATDLTTKRELKELFKTRFDRDEIIRILGMGDDPDIYTIPDEALCTLIYESFKIPRFFKYIRCSGCEEVKPNSEFAPSTMASGSHNYCRPCNTDRHRQMMLQNPELMRRSYQVQLTKPNKARIYQLRYYYRAQGDEDKMPPLPPKGTPDSEVVAPPKKPRGYGLAMWRATQPPTFDRKKAAKKVKQIVKNDAASRHIEL